jgi:hypothetical protein
VVGFLASLEFGFWCSPITKSAKKEDKIMSEVTSRFDDLDLSENEILAPEIGDECLEAASGTAHQAMAPSTAWMGTRWGCCPN